MIHADLAAVAAACDRLLREPGAGLARLAIPVLHFIDEHPGHLAQYGELLGYQGSQGSAGSVARIAGRIARDLGRSRGAAQPLSRAPLDTPLDVLIVSRSGPKHQGATQDDFYFGSMAQRFAQRGSRCTRVLIDELAGPAARELSVWQRCFAAQRALRRRARTADGLDAAVAQRAAGQAFSGVTAANLRVHAALVQLCNQLKPGIVITTYEGSASERLVWSAARAQGRRPLCVGYQHTRLLPHAHAVQRNVGAAQLHCDPDLILTLGEITQATLAASPHLQGVEFVGYGTHRRTAPLQPRAGQRRPRCCLVLADGSAEECALLFAFAYECARREPDLQFILRPHPIVNLQQLRSTLPWLAQLPSNVSLSSRSSLDEDCGEARYCLYRASSAAFHAVLNGLKPFYLGRRNELPLDPLAGLRHWHDTVFAAGEFLARVRDTDATSLPEAALEAWQYCNRYVAPVRAEALDELLSRHRGRSSSPSSSAMSGAK